MFSCNHMWLFRSSSHQMGTQATATHICCFLVCSDKHKLGSGPQTSGQEQKLPHINWILSVLQQLSELEVEFRLLFF